MDADRIMTRINPLVSAILRGPLHPLLSWGLMLITVTGRRSGVRYTIPVGYQKRDDRVSVLVSKAHLKQWWRNFEAPQQVDLVIRGRHATGTAELVDTGSERFRKLVDTTFRRVPGLHGQFGVDFDRKRGLTEEQAAAVGREGRLVEIVLDSVGRA